jgi:hypothetical protein
MIERVVESDFVGKGPVNEMLRLIDDDGNWQNGELKVRMRVVN